MMYSVFPLCLVLSSLCFSGCTWCSLSFLSVSCFRLSLWVYMMSFVSLTVLYFPLCVFPLCLMFSSLWVYMMYSSCFSFCLLLSSLRPSVSLRVYNVLYLSSLSHDFLSLGVHDVLCHSSLSHLFLNSWGGLWKGGRIHLIWGPWKGGRIHLFLNSPGGPWKAASELRGAEATADDGGGEAAEASWGGSEPEAYDGKCRQRSGHFARRNWTLRSVSLQSLSWGDLLWLTGCWNPVT